ncbi:MAG: hypothetical protein EXR86_12330 [Gammaproteobacteria bacterium]|nr:hypothetical protein [Gammaproteobacteria bacterium]
MMALQALEGLGAIGGGADSAAPEQTPWPRITASEIVHREMAPFERAMFSWGTWFPDQESARRYLESRQWPKGAGCPCCGLTERVTARKGRPGFYRCNQCHEDFTVRTGTIFERSHVPLHKWLYAMSRLVTAGIGSLKMSREIGISQKSAWFVLHRLREALGKDMDRLRGIIEADETYAGMKERSRTFAAPIESATPIAVRHQDQIADVVLGYRPKPKTKPAKKRARLRQRVNRFSLGNGIIHGVRAI